LHTTRGSCRTAIRSSRTGAGRPFCNGAATTAAVTADPADRPVLRNWPTCQLRQVSRAGMRLEKGRRMGARGGCETGLAHAASGERSSRGGAGDGGAVDRRRKRHTGRPRSLHGHNPLHGASRSSCGRAMCPERHSRLRLAASLSWIHSSLTRWAPAESGTAICAFGRELVNTADETRVATARLRSRCSAALGPASKRHPRSECPGAAFFALLPDAEGIRAALTRRERTTCNDRAMKHRALPTARPPSCSNDTTPPAGRGQRLCRNRDVHQTGTASQPCNTRRRTRRRVRLH
jgi:hypothetical protein